MGELMEYFNSDAGKARIQSAIDEVWITPHSKIKEMITIYNSMRESGMNEENMFPDKILYYQNKSKFPALDDSVLKYQNPQNAFLCNLCKTTYSTIHTKAAKNHKNVCPFQTMYPPIPMTYGLSENQKITQINQFMTQGKINILGRKVKLTLKGGNQMGKIINDENNGYVLIEFNVLGFKTTIRQNIQLLHFEGSKKIWA